MKINIEKLTRDELIELNHQIVARLKHLDQIKNHEEMGDFRIGEQVTFQPDRHPRVTGMITKFNKKTVTVITESGQHWNVSPALLEKVNSSGKSDNVLPFSSQMEL